MFNVETPTFKKFLNWKKQLEQDQHDNMENDDGVNTRKASSDNNISQYPTSPKEEGEIDVNNILEYLELADEINDDTASQEFPSCSSNVDVDLRIELIQQSSFNHSPSKFSDENLIKRNSFESKEKTKERSSKTNLDSKSKRSKNKKIAHRESTRDDKQTNFMYQNKYKSQSFDASYSLHIKDYKIRPRATLLRGQTPINEVFKNHTNISKSNDATEDIDKTHKRSSDLKIMHNEVQLLENKLQTFIYSYESNRDKLLGLDIANQHNGEYHTPRSPDINISPLLNKRKEIETITTMQSNSQNDSYIQNTKLHTPNITSANEDPENDSISFCEGPLSPIYLSPNEISINEPNAINLNECETQARTKRKEYNEYKLVEISGNYADVKRAPKSTTISNHRVYDYFKCTDVTDPRRRLCGNKRTKWSIPLIPIVPEMDAHFEQKYKEYKEKFIQNNQFILDLQRKHELILIEKNQKIRDLEEKLRNFQQEQTLKLESAKKDIQYENNRHLADLNKKMVILQKEKSEAEDKVKNKNEEIDTLKTQVNAIKSSKQEILDKLNEKIRINGILLKQNEELKLAKMHEETRSDILTTELTKSQSQLKEKEERGQRIVERRKTCETQIDNFEVIDKKDLEAMKSRLIELEKRNQHVIDDTTMFKLKVENLESQINDKNKKINQLEKELNVAKEDGTKTNNDLSVEKEKNLKMETEIGLLIRQKNTYEMSKNNLIEQMEEQNKKNEDLIHWIRQASLKLQNQKSCFKCREKKLLLENATQTEIENLPNGRLLNMNQDIGFIDDQAILSSHPSGDSLLDVETPSSSNQASTPISNIKVETRNDSSKDPVTRPVLHPTSSLMESTDATTNSVSSNKHPLNLDNLSSQQPKKRKVQSSDLLTGPTNKTAMNTSVKTEILDNDVIITKEIKGKESRKKQAIKQESTCLNLNQTSATSSTSASLTNTSINHTDLGTLASSSLNSISSNYTRDPLVRLQEMVMPTCVPRRSIELTQNEDTIQSAYEFWNNLTSQQRQHVEQCLQNYGVSDIQSNPQYFVTIAKEILLQIPIGQILPQRIQPTSISVNRSNLLNNIQMAMSHQLDPNLHNSERSNLHQQGLITNTNHQQMLRIHGPHVMSQMPNFSQNSMQQFSLQAVYMPVLQQESNMLRQTQINANPDVQAFIDTYGSLQNFPR